MTDLELLRDLGFIIAAAAALLLAARPLGIPSIIVYILAGVVLGPVTGLIHPTEPVELLSEAGIALLLFLVGLELSLDKIRAVGKAAVLGGVIQITLSVGLVFGAGLALGLGVLEAGFLGLALSFSSTVVVVKLLERRGELPTLHGRLAVGILLVQDIVVAVSLTLLAGLGAGGGTLEAGAVAAGLLRASIGMAALVVAAVVGAKWLLPRVFPWMDRSLEGLFIWSLTWCFGFILVAQSLELSVELGAFVAGVSLAQLAYNHELIRRVHPLVNFFLAVFFVSLGLELDPGSILRLWPLALGLAALVLVSKPIIVALLLSRMRYDRHTSFFSGLVLGQSSEFSFIMAALAVSVGLIAEETAALVALVGLLSIGISTALIEMGPRLYALLGRVGWLRPLGPERSGGEAEEDGLEGHVVVVGMNTLGRRLVDGFLERGETVLAVDTDPAKLRGLPCTTLLGNTEHPAVLQEAGVPKAKLVVSALQIEEANALLAYRTRQLGVPCAIHAFDPSLVPDLEAIGVSHLMISKYDGIRQVAEALRAEGVMD